MTNNEVNRRHIQFNDTIRLPPKRNDIVSSDSNKPKQGRPSIGKISKCRCRPRNKEDSAELLSNMDNRIRAILKQKLKLLKWKIAGGKCITTRIQKTRRIYFQ